MYDAMLYWGNFRQAYRELRQDKFEDIRGGFVQKRIDTGWMPDAEKFRARPLFREITATSLRR